MNIGNVGDRIVFILIVASDIFYERERRIDFVPTIQFFIDASIKVMQYNFGQSIGDRNRVCLCFFLPNKTLVSFVSFIQMTYIKGSVLAYSTVHFAYTQ